MKKLDSLALRWSLATHPKGHNPLPSVCGNDAALTSECLSEGLASLVDSRYHFWTKFNTHNVGRPDIFAAPHGRQAVSKQQPTAAALAPAHGSKRPADGSAEPPLAALKAWLRQENSLSELHSAVKSATVLDFEANQKLWTRYQDLEDHSMRFNHNAAIKPLLQPTRQHLTAAFTEFLDSCSNPEAIGAVANLSAACAQLQQPGLQDAFVEALCRCTQHVKPDPGTPAATSVAVCGSRCVLQAWDVVIVRRSTAKPGLQQQLTVLTSSDNVAPKLRPTDIQPFSDALEEQHNKFNKADHCFASCEDVQPLVSVFVDTLRRGDEADITKALTT